MIQSNPNKLPRIIRLKIFHQWLYCSWNSTKNQPSLLIFNFCGFLLVVVCSTAFILHRSSSSIIVWQLLWHVQSQAYKRTKMRLQNNFLDNIQGCRWNTGHAKRQTKSIFEHTTDGRWTTEEWSYWRLNLVSSPHTRPHTHAHAYTDIHNTI